MNRLCVDRWVFFVLLCLAGDGVLAPRNADGVSVDWRTGEPLRAPGPNGERMWYMRWDPDNGRWVAENPGRGYEMPGAGLPLYGTPHAYGYDEFGVRLPYANTRPEYDEDQIRQVWENSKQKTAGRAKNDDGSYLDYEKDDVIVQDINGNWYKVEWDPNQPGARPWDMGHNRGDEYWRTHDLYMNGKMSKEDFIEWYQNPENYSVQDPLRNRSHMDELPK